MLGPSRLGRDWEAGSRRREGQQITPRPLPQTRGPVRSGADKEAHQARGKRRAEHGELRTPPVEGPSQSAHSPPTPRRYPLGARGAARLAFLLAQSAGARGQVPPASRPSRSGRGQEVDPSRPDGQRLTTRPLRQTRGPLRCGAAERARPARGERGAEREPLQAPPVEVPSRSAYSPQTPHGRPRGAQGAARLASPLAQSAGAGGRVPPASRLRPAGTAPRPHGWGPGSSRWFATGCKPSRPCVLRLSRRSSSSSCRGRLTGVQDTHVHPMMMMTYIHPLDGRPPRALRLFLPSQQSRNPLKIS